MDISVSNFKDIIDYLLRLATKYGSGSLSFMVYTGAVSDNIFQQAEQIQIADMHHQAHRYFGLLGIGNIEKKFLPNHLIVSDL